MPTQLLYLNTALKPPPAYDHRTTASPIAAPA